MPREMRHSSVALPDGSGVPLEDIARLVGHSGTAVTETAYRKQIRPVLLGTEAMDRIFTNGAILTRNAERVSPLRVTPLPTSENLVGTTEFEPATP
ncbi:hypothetical protein [Streptosporangium minutum]|uniref:Tyr recombinase domain-containing protein n=1 Tax=Streptosporangium minutum TaxID=569862 RepID=A0A243RHJ9_9ACTN|nr:hypothetical protein [Streptosporangium minutum]OUC94234.1 hypothetical protein CA984_23145 [Streptosporangium minutum]